MNLLQDETALKEKVAALEAELATLFTIAAGAEVLGITAVIPSDTPTCGRERAFACEMTDWDSGAQRLRQAAIELGQQKRRNIEEVLTAGTHEKRLVYLQVWHFIVTVAEGFEPMTDEEFIRCKGERAPGTGKLWAKIDERGTAAWMSQDDLVEMRRRERERRQESIHGRRR